MKKDKVFWRATKDGAKLVVLSYHDYRDYRQGAEFCIGYCYSPWTSRGPYTAFAVLGTGQAEGQEGFKAPEEAKAWVESKRPWERFSGEKELQLDKMLPLPGHKAPA